MTDSRDDMLKLLEQHKRIIRQRTVDPKTIPLTAKSASSITDIHDNDHNNGKHKALQGKPSLNPNILHASENLRAFLEHYYRMFYAFAGDSSRLDLELTAELTSQDRRALHVLAEACNLAHHSSANSVTHERMLTIKKDVLFFKNKTGYREVDLDALAQRIASKDSKFDLRHIRGVDPSQREVGELGSYNDDEALSKILRFKRFTDEYRHAVDMGYSQDEAMAMSPDGSDGGRLEDILRRPAPDPEEQGLRTTPTGQTHSSGLGNSSRDKTRSSDPFSKARDDASFPGVHFTDDPIKSNFSIKTFLERCRCCRSERVVAYPIESWSCQKYCAYCGQSTIWSLIEVEREVAASPNRDTASSRKREHDNLKRDDLVSDQEDHSNKRQRVAQESIDRESHELEEVERCVEEIDVEEDELITVEDVVDMACSNDFAAEDTNWLRHFAFLNASHLSQSIFFCIKYEDMLDVYGRFERVIDKECKKCQNDISTSLTKETNTGQRLISTDVGASDVKNCVYVVIREDPMKRLKTTDLVEKMCQCAFSCPTSSTDLEMASDANRLDSERAAFYHTGLAFLNASVYGAATTVVCQLRPRIPSAWTSTVPLVLYPNIQELLRMEREYGKNQFYLAKSLPNAVRFAADEKDFDTQDG